MNSRIFLALLTIILITLVSCAPKTSPTKPAASIPTVGSEEAAWSQVVDAAKKQGTLTMYTSTFTGDIGKEVSKAFEAKYGIKLDFVTGVGATLMERLKSEQAAKKYFADTIDTSVVQVANLKQDGLTQSMDTLPVLKPKDMWVADPTVDADRHIVATRATVVNPYVNTKLVEPQDFPKSYKDLLAPKWKRKLVMGNPLTVPVTVWVYLVNKKSGALDDDFWRRLGQQEPQYVNSVRDSATLLMRGEAPFDVSNADVFMAPLAKEGAPIKAIEFVEGTILVPHSVGIATIKGAPHADAARVFINWILTQEGQTVLSQASGGILSLRKDVVDIRLPALKTEQKKLAIVDLDMQWETMRIQKEMTINKLLGIEK